MSNDIDMPFMAQRFRGCLPVVIDVETGGFNSRTDAILEIAATLLRMDDAGNIEPDETLCYQVEPFAGANLEQSALEFTGIDPHNPEREAKQEVTVTRSGARRVGNRGLWSRTVRGSRGR